MNKKKLYVLLLFATFILIVLVVVGVYLSSSYGHDDRIKYDEPKDEPVEAEEETFGEMIESLEVFKAMPIILIMGAIIIIVIGRFI